MYIPEADICMCINVNMLYIYTYIGFHYSRMCIFRLHIEACNINKNFSLSLWLDFHPRVSGEIILAGGGGFKLYIHFLPSVTHARKVPQCRKH